jgi:hypothetical protein
MRSKKGTSVPKMGTIVPNTIAAGRDRVQYAGMVATALRKDLGNTNSAIKTVMQWTDASERTVKYWFAGIRGPSGEHLSILARHSDAVVSGFLCLAGRDHSVAAGKIAEARGKLDELCELFDGLAGADG